ncbi:acetyltransferase [Dokdonia sp. Asnod1-B02]|uniref:acetyltransferase n=1 Tax=Dokdonia sp. Asnod1-B02 TaxID=3160573 RepID=UPI00386CE573
MSNKIYIFGYSGHSYVVIDSLEKASREVVGYFDKFKANSNPLNIEYKGDETLVNLESIVEGNLVFPAVGDNGIREKIIQLFEKYKLKQTVIIDPNALVSTKSIIGNSSFVASGAIVNSFTKIGRGCIINSGSIVEHDCTLGDYVHVAPGAVLTGSVSLGNSVFVGANAVINPGVVIGDNVIIGSGSVILRDIPKNTKWVGNPAKQI